MFWLDFYAIFYGNIILIETDYYLMLGFFKNKLISMYQSFSKKIGNIFSSPTPTSAEIESFFELLISFDVGTDIARDVINTLNIAIKDKTVHTPEGLLNIVKTKLNSILLGLPAAQANLPEVILLIGINGTGKTTTAAKLASFLSQNNKRVLLVAADTYRAAAVEQLCRWAESINVDTFVGKTNADPASVIFDAQTFAKNQGGYDYIIIDTAGRLHNNSNLTSELSKCHRVAEKAFSARKIATWLILDSMLGQNSFEQVKTFKQALRVDGIILTKLDSSAKGGVVFAIAKNFALPIEFITISENDLSGIVKFNAQEYVEQLFRKT